MEIKCRFTDISEMYSNKTILGEHCKVCCLVQSYITWYLKYILLHIIYRRLQVTANYIYYTLSY